MAQAPNDKNGEGGPLGDGKAVDRPSRRALLRAGSALLPAIITLHGRAAFGQGVNDPLRDLNQDYQQAYKYGTNQGQTTFQVHGISGNAVVNDDGETVWQDGSDRWHTWKK